MPVKRKAGRPKGSTKQSLTEETWYQKLLRMYEEGASDVEVCKALKITYNEFDKRTKQDDVFSQLVDYGRLAAKSWWYELGRKGARGEKNFNFQAWYAYMKNRFGWSDKAEITNAESKPIDQMSQDEIVAELASKGKRIQQLLGTSNVVLATMNVARSNDEPESDS